MPMRMLLVVATVLALVGRRRAAPPTTRRPPAAKRFYETGTLLYDRGEFLDAAKEFERAYREQPKPALLYNIASSYDKGGDRVHAVENYRKYVATMPGAPDVGVGQGARRRARARGEGAGGRQGGGVGASGRRAARNLPPPLPFVEPVTKYTYSTWIKVDGVPYTLIGAGARKVYGFKVYAMGLYLEDAPARKEFPALAAQRGRQRPRFAGARRSGASVRRARRLRQVGAAALRALGQRQGHARRLSRSARRRRRHATRRPTSSATPRRSSPCSTTSRTARISTIRTTGAGQVIVEAHGQKKLGPTNARLAHDIWDIWLGQKPISSDLKKGMLDRIDTLGR